MKTSKNLQRRLSVLWAVYALVYDVILILKPYTETLKRVCQVLYESEAQSVMDAGCGTGNLALYASQLGINSVWGIDSSKLMLRIARLKKRIWRNQLKDCHFDWADLDLAETWPQESFDAIVSIGVLHAVRDPQQATRHLVKHLKPGGTLIIVFPLPVSMRGIVREHLQTAGWWRLTLSALAFPLFAVSMIINLVQEAWVEKGDLHFLSMEETRSLVEQAGAEVKECSLVFGNAYTLVVGLVPELQDAI